MAGAGNRVGRLAPLYTTNPGDKTRALVKLRVGSKVVVKAPASGMRQRWFHYFIFFPSK